MGTTIGIMKEWPGTLSKIDAIRLIENLTDRDDPYWENVVEDHYDEKTDSMPSIFHVFAALGVTEDEYRKATGADNIVGWPDATSENGRLREFVAWVESWTCNPIGSYSVSALDGLFGMTRDKIAALRGDIKTEDTDT